MDAVCPDLVLAGTRAIDRYSWVLPRLDEIWRLLCHIFAQGGWKAVRHSVEIMTSGGGLLL
jgi:hypothetical protein